MSKVIAQEEIATPKIATPAKTKRPKLPPTKRITYCATFVAAALIFKILGNFLMLPGFKISLVYVPWILSAVFMGPFGGAVVGFATDVLGTVIAGSMPIPLVTLSNTLFPLIVGLIYRYVPVKAANARLLLGVGVTVVVCTLGLSTLGQTLYYGVPFLPYLVTYRLLQAVVVGFNAVCAVLLMPLMRKLKIAE